jgi:NADPH:quinone reductase-like Zn-dependent oxidoreductase
MMFSRNKPNFNYARESASKKVLITGITGQVGSYLADFFVAEGCEVHESSVAQAASTARALSIYAPIQIFMEGGFFFTIPIWTTPQPFGVSYSKQNPTRFIIWLDKAMWV